MISTPDARTGWTTIRDTDDHRLSRELLSVLEMLWGSSEGLGRRASGFAFSPRSETRLPQGLLGFCRK